MEEPSFPQDACKLGKKLRPFRPEKFILGFKSEKGEISTAIALTLLGMTAMGIFAGVRGLKQRQTA